MSSSRSESTQRSTPPSPRPTDSSRQRRASPSRNSRGRLRKIRSSRQSTNTSTDSVTLPGSERAAGVHIKEDALGRHERVLRAYGPARRALGSDDVERTLAAEKL